MLFLSSADMSSTCTNNRSGDHGDDHTKHMAKQVNIPCHIVIRSKNKLTNSLVHQLDPPKDGMKNYHYGHMNLPISEEERIIRCELEKEVERSLEEEIKDGICNLALRLHRLYQHQKERTKKSEAYTELNITIKMEGRSRIEICECKKSPKQGGHRFGKEDDKQTTKNVSTNVREFDWVKTLRSKPQSISSNKKSASFSDAGRKVGNHADMDRRKEQRPYYAHERKQGISWR